MNRLLSDELDYELRVRGLSSEGTVAEKRSALRGALKAEGTGFPFRSRVLECDPARELEVCDRKLEELAAYVRVFDIRNRDNEFQRIRSRLVHLAGRLGRFPDEASSTSGVVSRLMSRCMQLSDLLEQKYNGQEGAAPVAEQSLLDAPNVLAEGVSLLDDPVPLSPDAAKHPPTRTSSNQQFTEHYETIAKSNDFRDAPANVFPDFDGHRGVLRSGDVEHHSLPLNIRTVEPLPAAFVDGNRNMGGVRGSDAYEPRNFVPIHKWNVTFDGESSLFSFLERVEELREARGVGKSAFKSSS